MKKIFICLFTAFMLLSLISVSAITLDTAEGTEVSEASLMETTFPVAHKPGINLATGTSEPLTFEGMTDIGTLFKSLSNATYVKDCAVADISGLSATGNTSGKALRIGLYKNTGADGTATATGGWQGVHLNMNLQMNRKYYIAADEYADLYTINPDAAIIGDTFALWSKGIQNTDQALGNNSKAGKWYKQVWDNDLNHMPSNHFTGAFSFAFQLTSDTAYNAYVDNLMVVPYYSITYMGDTTETEWFLFDESGNIATEYTVRTDNFPANSTDNGKIKECIGWSVFEDSSVASEKVSLANADVVLYPVWKEAEIVSADTTILGDEGTAIITAASDVTWSYEENSDVLRVMGSTARTIELFTTEDHASGEFTVTATTADGVSTSVTIKVIKSTVTLRPGLNMLTGTVKPMDFENYETVPGLFSLTNTAYINSITLGSVPVESSGNLSTTALRLSRNSSVATQAWQSVFRISSILEKSRPYSVSATMFTDLYINGSTVNSGHNARIYWGWTGGSAGSAWVNFDNNFTNPAKNATWYTYTNKKLTYSGESRNDLPIGFEFTVNDLKTEGYYFDDLLIMPYYKITYKNPDGTDAATEYVLYDDEGNLLTEYTIDTTKVSGATGYAISQEAADAGQFITSVALENEDIVIYTSAKEYISFTDGETIKTVEATENFTFPTPEELGFSTENFVKWTNGTDHYSAGECVSDASECSGTFTAFYQDMQKGAMAFAFEGVSGTVDESSKTTARGYVKADGRTYYNVRMYNESGAYPADAKFWFNANRFGTGTIDGSEYTIFTYGAKVLNAANLTDSVVTPIENATLKIFYHGSAWSGLSENRRIGNKIFTVPVGEYFETVYDMDNLPDVEWHTNKIANIIVEPVRTNYSFDVYFDYIRVYRKGLTTVTYDTNAPTGATVTANVPAETGRGVGKDYRLTGLRPAVEGYVFMGWSLTEDGTETVTMLDLTGDTTVYAVWAEEESYSAPYVTDVTEIRGNGDNNGIRFKSVISNPQKANFTEFGFITTREALLPTEDGELDYSALNFDFKTVSTASPKYAYGVSYKPASEIDVMYGNDDQGGIIYTAVLTGIPLEYKKEKMAVRNYAKYEINGNEITVYGNTHSASLYDTALEIKENSPAAYEANKDYIDSILAE